MVKKLILTTALFALMLATPALAESAPERVKIYHFQPVGKGDPSGISCYQKQLSPVVRKWQCKRNSEWARLDARLNAQVGDTWGRQASPVYPDH